MRLFKTFAVAALLATSAGATMAAPYEAHTSLRGLDQANYATVLKDSPSEARQMEIGVDTAALQQIIKNNPALARTVVQQGFTIGEIVGADSTGGGTSVTLYAL
jgi:hypothetical protein